MQPRCRVTRPVLRDHFPPAARQRPTKTLAPLSFVRLSVCSSQFSPKPPVSCSVNRSSAGHGDAESILGMRGRRMQRRKKLAALSLTCFNNREYGQRNPGGRGTLGGQLGTERPWGGAEGPRQLV